MQRQQAARLYWKKQPGGSLEKEGLMYVSDSGG